MKERQEDITAIRDVLEGQIDQYAVIVRKYTKVVHSFIAQRLYDKEEIDDIVQNAFVKFYKALDKFDQNREVLPYLLEIAKNEMKMYLRAKKKTYSLDERIQTSGSAELINDTIDLDSMLESLSPEQQKALLMLGEGYSYQEVAVELKRPLNTVKTIVRRARLALQKVNV